MKNSKEWFSVSELLSENLKDLPSTDKGISKKADREGWQKRQRTGVRGKTFEYYVGDMPPNVQAALGFKFQLPESPSNSRDDFIVTTPTGREIGLDIKATLLKGSGGNRDELMQAIRLIEDALLNIGNKKPDESFNNIERHLVQCFRKASEEGRVAILTTAESMASLQEKKEEAQSSKDNLNAA